jgi:hypothetical protein
MEPVWHLPRHFAGRNLYAKPDVATVPYPVGVSFTDSANKPYQFTLNSAPPYSNTPTKAPIVGCTPAAWCVNVSARTAYDIISGKPDSTVSAPMPVK